MTTVPSFKRFKQFEQFVLRHCRRMRKDIIVILNRLMTPEISNIFFTFIVIVDNNAISW